MLGKLLGYKRVFIKCIVVIRFIIWLGINDFRNLSFVLVKCCVYRVIKELFIYFLMLLSFIG